METDRPVPALRLHRHLQRHEIVGVDIVPIRQAVLDTVPTAQRRDNSTLDKHIKIHRDVRPTFADCLRSSNTFFKVGFRAQFMLLAL